ncbi:hypothetical protein IQ255_04470 [Pleurocapsales cyanobacterium LEGE 10410]|nr:hypothetical protein [Pleurocapsales cyanobacterium LEGE 10410]
MLKITYLEDGIYVEYLSKTVETWKAARTIFSLRAAVSIYLESSTACLILQIDLPHLTSLTKLAEEELIDIILCDEEYVELSLLGTWVSQSKDSEEGTFVCDLGHENENLLYKLWQESQIGTSVVSE